ncbi:carbon-nitrogen hydrolase family protein [Isosphaeraceae bacterium EP7]
MSTSKLVRVAAVQMEPKLGKLGRNLDAILSKLDEAAATGAALIAFPECALTGYGFGSKAEGMDHAETIPGPATNKVAEACARLGVHAVFGLLERDGDRLFNACVLVGPSGLVGSYRKIHLPFLGIDMHVDPGDRPLDVLNAGDVRIGMHICYDAGFPETGRIQTLLGADLLVLPTNWPTHAECAAEHMMPTRAMENVVYAMAINRVGEEAGFRFIGRSSIVDPAGNVLAMAGPDEEVILQADIDPIRARTKRLIRVPGKHEVDRIGDRRPAFYGPLIEPNGRA